MNDYKRVLLVVLGVALLIWSGIAIKGAIDSGGAEKARLYNTAIMATQQDRFNYALDSHQGRVITRGEFTADKPVKFPEMSKRFGYVRKTKETYNQHTREVCETKYRSETRTRTVTDSDGNSHTDTYTEEVPYEECHTEVYYSWDYESSDEISSPDLMLFSRKYPSSTFNLDGFKHNADACEFTPKNTAGWLEDKKGCDGGYYYTNDTTRYDYDVIDTKFTASMALDTSDGTLKQLMGGSKVSLDKRSPEQIVKDANNYGTPGAIFIVFWLILIIGGMGTLAYAWVMADGVWR